MAEVGIDISREHPKRWTDEIVQAADVVVTMGCGDACPLVRAKRRIDWQIPDPRDMPPEEFRTVRDLIPKVKAAGGQGIVEYPLNKIVV